VDLGGAWPGILEEYVRKGGTLVVNVEAAQPLPKGLLGLAPTGKMEVAEEWRPEGGGTRSATPFDVAEVQLEGASVLAWAAPKRPLITHHKVGAGAVIVTLAPRLLGQDERAHPALPFLLNGLTAGLLPIEVRRGGQQSRGGRDAVLIDLQTLRRLILPETEMLAAQREAEELENQAKKPGVPQTEINKLLTEAGKQRAIEESKRREIDLFVRRNKANLNEVGDDFPFHGGLMYQVNKTKDGYLVMLVNNQGVDKTQNGVARVDRRAWADVVVRTRLLVKTAKEYTEPRDLAVAGGKEGAEIRLRVHPGDVQVVYLTIGK
jgi:hypothetical protein